MGTAMLRSEPSLTYTPMRTGVKSTLRAFEDRMSSPYLPPQGARQDRALHKTNARILDEF